MDSQWKEKQNKNAGPLRSLEIFRLFKTLLKDKAPEGGIVRKELSERFRIVAKRVFNGGQTAEETQRRGQKQQTGDLGKTLLAAKAKSEDHK